MIIEDELKILGFDNETEEGFLLDIWFYDTEERTISFEFLDDGFYSIVLYGSIIDSEGELASEGQYEITKPRSLNFIELKTFIEFL